MFPSTGKRVVITEGELDAASCSEAMPGWPMVSLPSGAAAARKSIQRALQWLQGYEEIVLFFDNDEAGRKAAEDAAGVLPPGKTKIARLEEYKDASDALQVNDTEAIRRAIWDAKPYRPDGIVDGKSLLEVVTTPNPPSDHDYPFEGLQQKLHKKAFEIYTKDARLNELLPDVWERVGWTDTPDMTAEFIAHSSKPSEGGNRLALLSDVAAGLARLNKNDKDLLRMRYGNGGMDFAALAETYGASDEAIRKRVKRALDKLQDRLGGEPPIWRGRRRVRSNAEAQAEIKNQEEE